MLPRVLTIPLQPPHAVAVSDAASAIGTPAAKTVAEDTPAVFSAAELTAGAADIDTAGAVLSVGAIRTAKQRQAPSRTLQAASPTRPTPTGLALTASSTP